MFKRVGREFSYKAQLVVIAVDEHSGIVLYVRFEEYHFRTIVIMYHDGGVTEAAAMCLEIGDGLIVVLLLETAYVFVAEEVVEGDCEVVVLDRKSVV